MGRGRGGAWARAACGLGALAAAVGGARGLITKDQYLQSEATSFNHETVEVRAAAPPPPPLPSRTRSLSRALQPRCPGRTLQQAFPDPVPRGRPAESCSRSPARPPSPLRTGSPPELRLSAGVCATPPALPSPPATGATPGCGRRGEMARRLQSCDEAPRERVAPPGLPSLSGSRMHGTSFPF